MGCRLSISSPQTFLYRYIGKIFAKDESSYQYLVESIRMHPDQKTLQSMMQNQGFDNTGFQNLSGGIVAIHQGYKF
jgi:demethylmenaquinone methyltransferase/2-methoxy-6-polyprenyl-1,4-benzoquinol methylase